MELFPVKFCKSVRTKWGRRYERLEGERRILRRGKLGGGGYRRPVKVRRVLWRFSPVVFLRRMKDLYISGMLGLAEKSGGVSGSSPPEALWSRRVPKGRLPPPAPMDFDSRILIEIYKSLVPTRELNAF